MSNPITEAVPTTDLLDADDIVLLKKFGTMIQRETTGSEEWDPILHSAGASIVRLCSQLTASEQHTRDLELLLQREPAQGHTKMWQDQRRAILAKGETK